MSPQLKLGVERGVNWRKLAMVESFVVITEDVIAKTNVKLGPVLAH